MGGGQASGMFFFASNRTPEPCLSQASQQFSITLVATKKKSWDLKKFLGDKPVFHQDDQTGQAFAICFPGLANVFVLTSYLAGVSLSLWWRQQPHSVVQRRLLEGNLNKLRGTTRVQSAWVQSPLAKDQDEKTEKGEDRRQETSALLIQCQVRRQHGAADRAAMADAR